MARTGKKFITSEDFTLRLLHLALPFLLLTGLTACGGSGGGSGGGDEAPIASPTETPESSTSTTSTSTTTTLPAPQFKVGGQLLGLSHDYLQAEVVLSVSGVELDRQTLNLSTNGAFEFADNSVDGATYTVSILRQPQSPSINCVLSGATGTIAGADVTSVLITCPALQSLSVSSSRVSIALDQTLQFSATATFAGGLLRDVSSHSTWSSSQSSVASINSMGLATGLSAGSTSVIASFGGLNSNRNMNVTAATLQSVSINPTSVTLEIGGETQLSVIGVFSDGTTQNLTSTASWSSANSAIASTAALFPGRVRAESAGSAVITATVQGLSATRSVTVQNITLSSLEISPIYRSLSLGASLLYQATGVFSDGSRRDLSSVTQFSSSHPSIAQVQSQSSSGALVQTQSAGTTQIEAEYLGITSTATLVVSNKTLISLTLETPASLALNFQSQLRALGQYSDGSTSDLTQDVIWSSSNESLLSVGNATGTKGLASALQAGTVTITIETQGLQTQASVTVSGATLSSIEVSPSRLLISRNTNFKVRARGVFTDGSSIDLTEEVSWTSSNTSHLQVTTGGDSAGNISNTSTGSGYPTVNITASLNGVTSTAAQITITPATLTGVVLNPVSITMPLYETLYLKAYASFSDGGLAEITDLVTWSSSSSSSVFVSNAVSTSGEMTSLQEGSATVSASFSGVSAQQTVTVNDSLPLTSTTQGIGLTSSYFSGRIGVSPVLKGQRIDARISYNWNTGTAPLGVGDSFSIRFEGKLQAPSTGTYQLCTRSDDGIRMWIYGTDAALPQIINNWTDHAVTENCSGNLNLTAGQKYDVTLEFYENGGHAVVELYWSGPGLPKAIIPSSALFPSP